MKVLLTLALALIAALIIAASVIYAGIYNVGADDPHWPLTYQVMQMTRSRSIAVRTETLKVPDLADPQRVLKGAGQYAAMCTNCHLAPGMRDSEIRPGLYPQPPNLSKHLVDPKTAFWVIKHGIKMSAMPAWGSSHDDDTIWSMVAFLQQLPAMTPSQYKDIVAKAPPDDDMDGDRHTISSPEAMGNQNAKPASAMSAMPAMQ